MGAEYYAIEFLSSINRTKGTQSILIFRFGTTKMFTNHLDDSWCWAKLRNSAFVCSFVLEKRMNIFELRLEATLGIVFCALCLLISSTACCSHRHHGRRALSSLASLFISGDYSSVFIIQFCYQSSKLYNICIINIQHKSNEIKFSKCFIIN